ncbi:MAG: hypothetical protein Q9167_005674 [Letrouitia subvulpina]
MASPDTQATLPQYLLTGWRFKHNARRRAQDNDELKDWTVSSLASAYLKHQLDHHEQLIKQQDVASKGRCTPSLAELAIQKILNMLTLSFDLRADVKRITETVDSQTLKLLLKDPRIPYPFLYLLYEQSAISNETQTNRKIVDIDETILAGESNIRSAARVNDRRYLVKLDDLRILFGSQNTTELLDIKRKTPPKGGFEFLHKLRSNAIRIHASDRSFSASLDRIIEGILYGLDWSNVFVAGGTVLTALLHTHESEDETMDFTDSNVDMYLYGLTPTQANAKVEEIYMVWKANLPQDDNEVIVRKTPNTIHFTPKFHPIHGIHIVTKLFHSPLDILLNFDLDALAVGFDGSQVMMLPRCARAIETGYSVFTMDLICRHHPSSHQTYDFRVFRHADRGFGFRILPSYIKALELHRLESTVPNLPIAEYDKTDLNKIHFTLLQSSDRTACQTNEPGLKSLRRIEHLAKQYVQWKCFGSSECPLGSPEWDKSQLALSTDHQVLGSWLSPPASLSAFESFMRECEAWRLNDMGIAMYGTGTISLALLRLSYNGVLPFPEPSLSDLELDTDLNDGLFSSLRKIINSRVHQQGTYRGYLTRRIRHTIDGEDLTSVQAKQLTLPLVIPADLQDFITQEITSRYPELGSLARGLLIPIHNPNGYRPLGLPALPPLVDNNTESGNLRYWLITKESMWAGQHYALGEAAKLLSVLFQWFFLLGDNENFSHDRNGVLNRGTDNPNCIWYVADELRQQLILPNLETSAPTTRRLGIPLKEALLFRSWVAEAPETEDADAFWSQRAPMDEDSTVDDSLFWKSGDEGDWEEEGAPGWTW